MVQPLRLRQTKGGATAIFYLRPPRHISTLPILLQKSKIEQLRKSRECRFLVVSAAATPCRTDTAACGRFCVKRCGFRTAACSYPTEGKDLTLLTSPGSLFAQSGH